MKSDKKGFSRNACVGQQLVPLMPPMRRYSLLRKNADFKQVIALQRFKQIQRADPVWLFA